MNNQKSKLKTWPLVFGCMQTASLHTELNYSYGTDAFLVCYDAFTSVRGKLAYVHTDAGTQLIKTAEYVGEKHPQEWDWDLVKDKLAKEETKFVHCGQWRNGTAEQRVRAMKEVLDQLYHYNISNLNFAEFATLLKKCTNVVNDNPLGVRKNAPGVEGEIIPLTPNLLLTDRTSTGDLAADDGEEEDKYSERISYINRIETLWWSMWFNQVWDSLFPYRKWKEVKDNLLVGDICLLGWEPKLGKGRYRICRVSKIFPNVNGRVRTVTVEARPKSSTEKGLPYIECNLEEITIPVQRLALIHRARVSIPTIRVNPPLPIANKEKH